MAQGAPDKRYILFLNLGAGVMTRIEFPVSGPLLLGKLRMLIVSAMSFRCCPRHEELHTVQLQIAFPLV